MDDYGWLGRLSRAVIRDRVERRRLNTATNIMLSKETSPLDAAISSAPTAQRGKKGPAFEIDEIDHDQGQRHSMQCESELTSQGYHR